MGKPKKYNERYRHKCPTPNKKRFKSFAAAIEFLAFHDYPGLYPYQCVCTAIHTGHPNGRLSRSAKRRWDRIIAKQRKCNSARHGEGAG